MSTTNRAADCAICSGAMEPAEAACGNCHATRQWQDLARANQFVLQMFGEWRERGLIDEGQFAKASRALSGEAERIASAAHEGQPYPSNTGLASATGCWRCGRPVAGFYAYCNTCGAPLGEQADTLRYLAYLTRELSKASADQMTLAQINGCTADVQRQIAELRTKLEGGGLSTNDLAAARLSRLCDLKSGTEYSPLEGDPVTSDDDAAPAEVQFQPASPLTPTTKAHRSLLEILLDPRNIQWLLGSGGGLLVVGLVIWLASLGVFKNAIVVASCMGVGTIALLAGGCSVVKLTRHELAGRAITLLACLVMPLNLWFYHSHNLVTLDGHLWAAAVVCCALYAVAAAVLEDAVFVYVLSAGVAMTGLLILADMHKLAEIAAPSTLLIVLGLVALHVERAFAENDGPFSRKRFGMACFWSAQALLGSGLLLLLGAQLAGTIPAALAWLGGQPMIVTDPSQRWLAIGLVLAGAYAYLYSDLVVRRVGVYIYLSAFALLWAQFLVIDVTQLTDHPAVLIGALSVTALAVNIALAIALGRKTPDASSRLVRSLPSLGLILTAAPLLLGVTLHLRATVAGLHNVWPYAMSWSLAAAMATVVAACSASSSLTRRLSPRFAAMYLIGAAGTLMLTAAAALSLTISVSPAVQSSILMAIPIAYLVASRQHRDVTAKRALGAFAQISAALLLMPILSAHTSMSLSLLCAESAVFYVIAAGISGNAMNVYLATATAAIAGWQAMSYFDYSAQVGCAIFAGIGVAMLIIHRIATPASKRFANSPLSIAAIRGGNALASLSIIASSLIVMSNIALSHTTLSLALQLAAVSAMSLLCGAVVGRSAFRRFYVAMAALEGALMLVILEQHSHLSGWQKTQWFSVILGLFLLVAGYARWFRDQETFGDSAQACLFFGSLFAGIPLIVAAIVNRFGYQISLVDELALITVSLLMFVTGFMSRARSTTLIGGGLLVLHLAMLLVFIGMEAQLTVGVYLSIGGALLFALGVILSIHRDRLLSLPQRIKRHEGIFRVLAWR